MKRLFFVFFIGLQVFTSTSALAWSPLDVYRSVVEPDPQCLLLVAGTEESQEENNNNETEEEEEEPDCD